MLSNYRYHRAFTMIELIFVIVIIGILTAIAIPKFSNTVTLAEISKAKSEVAAMRSAVSTERQKRILRGQVSTGDNIDDDEVPGLLEYGLGAGWDGLTFTGPEGNECAFSVEVAGSLNKLVITSCSVQGMTDL